MASNNNRNTNMSSAAKQELDKYKMEATNEVGVDLTKDNLTAKEAGTVGGHMVRSMINKAKNSNH